MFAEAADQQTTAHTPSKPIACCTRRQSPLGYLCCAACRQDEGSVPAAGYSLHEACLLTRSSMPQQRTAALDLLRRVLLQARSKLVSMDLRRGSSPARTTGVVGETAAHRLNNLWSTAAQSVV